MIWIKQASTQQAEEIARLYLESFPESVDFFFNRDDPSRLRSLTTMGFCLLLLAGCRSFIALDKNKHPLGYCVVSKSNKLPFHHLLYSEKMPQVFNLFYNSVAKLRPSELIKLTYNWLLFTSGSITNKPIKNPGGRIMSIAVHPAARNQGLGKLLLKYALYYLDKHGISTTYLEVRSDNLPAKKLYERTGFSVYGKTKDLQGVWLKMIRIKNPASNKLNCGTGSF